VCSACHKNFIFHTRALRGDSEKANSMGTALEIARMVGFEDPEFFRNDFLRMMELPLGDYRGRYGVARDGRTRSQFKKGIRTRDWRNDKASR
jgi:AraC-like DNA-binding protein